MRVLSANGLAAVVLLVVVVGASQSARSHEEGGNDHMDIGPSATKFLPDPPEGKVTVQLSARPVKASMPGEFKFYMAPPDLGKVFKTVSVPKGQAVPKGQEIENGIAFMDPGVFYTLQVLYENDTDEDVEFTVVAPELDPQAAMPYARALCMCAAIPFTVPAGGAWYRIIQVGVANNTPPGAKTIVTWPVIRSM
jgi:hypothetical protein